MSYDNLPTFQFAKTLWDKSYQGEELEPEVQIIRQR